MKKSKLYSEYGKLDLEHTLYLVILRNETEAFCKIGITSQTIEMRMSWIEGYEYTLVTSVKGPGIEIRGLESMLKEAVLEYGKKHKPKLHLKGFTECYQLNYLKDIESAFKYLTKKVKQPVKKEINTSFSQQNYNTLVGNYNILKENNKILKDNQIILNSNEEILKKRIKFQDELLKDYENQIMEDAELIKEMDNEMNDMVNQIVKLEGYIPDTPNGEVTEETKLYDYINDYHNELLKNKK